MTSPSSTSSSRPLVIAHRGASGDLPENTMAAYQRAVEVEADMIEIDQFADRMDFNLEIKVGTSADYEGIEERTLAALEERGLLAKTLFSSFSDAVLERLRRQSSAARLAVLVSPRAPFRAIERAKAVEAEAVNPGVPMVTQRFVARAHESGLRVFPYTEDDPAAMARLLDCGVDGIFTNHPARLRALLIERGEL